MPPERQYKSWVFEGNNLVTPAVGGDADGPVHVRAEDGSPRLPVPLEDVVADVAPRADDDRPGPDGLQEGLRVGVLDLTSGEPTPHGTPEIRARETAAATAILGLDWRYDLGLPNRSLEATIENRAKLAAVFRQQRPRWLFAPYWVDAHPDHVAATRLVEDARFWSKLTKTDLPGAPHHPQRIYNYYCVHLKMALQPAFVLDISDVWEQKVSAIRCYESQFITGRPNDRPTLSAQGTVVTQMQSIFVQCSGLGFVRTACTVAQR